MALKSTSLSYQGTVVSKTPKVPSVPKISAKRSCLITARLTKTHKRLEANPNSKNLKQLGRMPTTHPTSLITNHLKSAPLAEPQLSRPPGGSPRVIQSLQVQMANRKNLEQKSHMAFKSVAVLQMTLKKNINTRCIISKV